MFLLHNNSVLGHEGVVEVIEHKSQNLNLKIGDRITFTIADFCQQCERCEGGLQQKCLSLFKVDYNPFMSNKRIIYSRGTTVHV